MDDTDDPEEPKEPKDEPETSSRRKRGGLILLGGGSVTAAALLISPDEVLQPRGAGSGHGIPLWTLGVALLCAGAWELTLDWSPAVAAAVERRPYLSPLLGLGLLATLIVLTYR